MPRNRNLAGRRMIFATLFGFAQRFQLYILFPLVQAISIGMQDIMKNGYELI